jgi:hypothetical protein
MLHLVHIPVLAILGDRVSRMLGQIPFDAQDSWWNNRLYIPDVGPAGMRSRFLVTLAVLLPICLAVSDIGTRLLDVPSVKAGKIITRRLGSERGTAQSYMEAETDLTESLRRSIDKLGNKQHNCRLEIFNTSMT